MPGGGVEVGGDVVGERDARLVDDQRRCRGPGRRVGMPMALQNRRPPSRHDAVQNAWKSLLLAGGRPRSGPARTARRCRRSRSPIRRRPLPGAALLVVLLVAHLRAAAASARMPVDDGGQPGGEVGHRQVALEREIAPRPCRRPAGWPAEPERARHRRRPSPSSSQAPAPPRLDRCRPSPPATSSAGRKGAVERGRGELAVDGDRRPGPPGTPAPGARWTWHEEPGACRASQQMKNRFSCHVARRGSGGAWSSSSSSCSVITPLLEPTARSRISTRPVEPSTRSRSPVRMRRVPSPVPITHGTPELAGHDGPVAGGRADVDDQRVGQREQRRPARVGEPAHQHLARRRAARPSTGSTTTRAGPFARHRGRRATPRHHVVPPRPPTIVGPRPIGSRHAGEGERELLAGGAPPGARRRNRTRSRTSSGSGASSSSMVR